MRSLALDIGDKRIGVAISDELGVTARGLFAIERKSLKEDTGRILDLVKEYEAENIVAGLPLNLSGSDSKQTEKVRDFTEKLGNKLRSSGMSNVKLILHDERFTTKIAESALIEADMRREKRRKIIDQQAAAIILQSWLDSRQREI